MATLGKACGSFGAFVAGDQNLINHLGVLPGSGASLMDDRLAHHGEAGLQRIDDLFVAAERTTPDAI